MRYLLKLFYRKFKIRPLYPAVSLIGLVIGFTSCFFVGIWIYNELSYDIHYPKAERTYRLTVDIKNEETGFHWDFARSMLGWMINMPEEIPGVESMVRLAPWREGITRYKETVAPEVMFGADTTVIEIFDIQLIQGNSSACLSAPGQVIISESAARKYLGTNNPIGEILHLYCSRCEEQLPFTVTGVFKDFPINSHVHPNIINSRPEPEEPPIWAYYYVTLEEGVKPEDVVSNFKSFASKYVSEKELDTYYPQLQSIHDIHLKSHKDRELEHNGSIVQIKVLTGLALFVLLITLFNYFNLRYVTLLRDLKALKILTYTGARKGNIFLHSITDSVFTGLVAISISCTLVSLMLPAFNRFIGKAIGLHVTSIFPVVVVLSGALLVIVVLVGILPHQIINSSKQIRSMLHTQQSNEAISARGINSGLLEILVGVQYVVAFILIIAVVVMNGQLQLFMENSLGSSNEKLICVKKLPVQIINKYDVFKEELLKSPLIDDITTSMENPGDEIRDMMGFELQGALPELNKKKIYVSPVADNFFSFYDIPIVAGSDFPLFTGNDSLAENFIINQKAASYLELTPDEAVGRAFRLVNNYTSKEFGQIVGVVKDFQPSSMINEVLPYVYLQKSYWLFSAQVRYDTSRTAESIDHIRNSWMKVYPDFPFNYDFVENLYQDIYQKEFQLQKMSLLLCTLSILIAAMGLFAITGITYRTRTKEIGIRKVNGARLGELIRWLMRDIVIIVMIALVIAIPLSYYLAGLWLDNYINAYCLSPGIYVIAGIVLFSIALLTVSWQTWRAATQNPVKALRYE